MNKFLAASALTVLATLSGLASAGTATANFTVSLTIQSGCSVSATDVNVGSYPASTSTGVLTSSATNTISVTCTKGTPYSIGLQSTRTGAATDGTGILSATNTGTTGNTDTIAYGLFQDASGSAPWGAAFGTNTVTGTVSTDGTSAKTYSVYARVQGNAITNKTADTYKDTVKVSVNY